MKWCVVMVNVSSFHCSYPLQGWEINVLSWWCILYSWYFTLWKSMKMANNTLTLLHTCSDFFVCVGGCMLNVITVLTLFLGCISFHKSKSTLQIECTEPVFICNLFSNLWTIIACTSWFVKELSAHKSLSPNKCPSLKQLYHFLICVCLWHHC